MDKNCIDETSSEMIDETAESSDLSENASVPNRLPCICTRCGAHLPDNANFCTYCGKNRFSSPDYAPGRNVQGRRSDEQEGKSYGLLALVFIIVPYLSLLIYPECFFLLVFVLGIPAVILAGKSSGHSKKGRIPSIITIVLVALPMLLLAGVMFMTIYWFAQHPNWEP